MPCAAADAGARAQTPDRNTARCQTADLLVAPKLKAVLRLWVLKFVLDGRGVTHELLCLSLVASKSAF